MTRFCFNCGNEVQPEWKVCAACGAKLDQDEDESVIQTPPVQPYQPQPYQQPQYGAPAYRPAQYPGTSDNTKGILSLIIGIGAICSWCFIIIVPLVLGVIAVILGAVAVNTEENKAFSIIGIILGIVGIILELFFWLIVFAYS